MKSEEEIIKAHDMITGILLGEAPNPWSENSEGMLALLAAADVLCWVLDHDHNYNFALNLASLEAFTKAQGHWVAKPQRKCLVCGCTERTPCTTPTGPCGWIREDLCSACEERVLNLGIRSIEEQL